MPNVAPAFNRRCLTRGVAAVLGASVALSGLSGCGADLAVLGAAASAASTGSSVFKQGKLNASWLSDFEEVVTAGERALDELGFELLSSVGDSSKGEWTVTARDASDAKIIVRVTRRTLKLTEFVIDVGWFGSESTARLLLKRMAEAINLDENGRGLL